MLMAYKVKNLDDLEEFLNQNHVFDLLAVDRIGVFGSFARGEEANDIDLLLDEVSNKSMIVQVKEELEKKIGKKIDIVIVQYANPIILHRAKKDLIYVKKYKK